MNLPDCCDDLLRSAPKSVGERARRWSAVRRAVAVVSPHLTAGGIPALRPRDLRIAFLAIDLHYFHAAYRALFEDERDVGFAWSLCPDDCGDDAVVEEHPGPEGSVLELILDSRRLAAAASNEGRRIAAIDGKMTDDALDVVLIVLARCMLHAAAIVASETPRAIDRLLDELLRRLLPAEGATAP